MNPTEQPLEIIQDQSAAESLERAQIDCQIATAKKHPRTLSKVKADMLSFATLDEETASSCFYTLPRGGKTIQGPSVRMAEIAVACYSNLRVGARPIQVVTDGPHPHVVVQAAAHDLERNVAITIEKRRRIVGKKSRGGAIDEDDINLAVNACASIAFRDAVFKVVPGALIKPVYEQAKRVAIGDVKSLASKRQQVFDRFKQMGLTEARILAAVEVAKIDDVTVEKLEALIGIGTAIRDGDTTIEEAFPMRFEVRSGAPQAAAPESQTQKQEPAKAEVPTEAPAPKAEPAPEPKPALRRESNPAHKKISDPLVALLAKMEQAGLSEAAVLEFARKNELIEESIASLKDANEVTPTAIRALNGGFDGMLQEISAGK